MISGNIKRVDLEHICSNNEEKHIIFGVVKFLRADVSGEINWNTDNANYCQYCGTPLANQMEKPKYPTG